MKKNLIFYIQMGMNVFLWIQKTFEQISIKKNLLGEKSKLLK